MQPPALRDHRANVVRDRTRAHTNRELDMRAAITQCADPPEIISYHGETMPADSGYAEHLLGLAKVSLRPLAGVSTHGVAAAMMEQGTFEPAIAELLADRL